MGKLIKFDHSWCLEVNVKSFFELCCSEIKITYNFKLKLVCIDKTTGRKATKKLIQEATSNLKLK